MDLSEPASALATGLTVPVLRALSRRSSKVTAAQLARMTGKGTEAGVRRAVERLALHGVVRRDQVGDRTVYSLNDNHILRKAVEALLGADDELRHRLRAEISGWAIAPVSAALYGSAARRDGDTASDIDILIIRPVMPSSQRFEWAAQIRELRNRVESWTGNRCQITDRSTSSVRKMARSGEPIVGAWRDDSVHLAGSAIEDVVAAK